LKSYHVSLFANVPPKKLLGVKDFQTYHCLEHIGTVKLRLTQCCSKFTNNHNTEICLLCASNYRQL